MKFRMFNRRQLPAIHDAADDLVDSIVRPIAESDEEVSMSNNQSAASLLDEVAMFFASGPSPSAILEFRPSQATMDRANQLLELNRSGALDDGSRRELDQFEMAETLMRLVKARIRAGQSRAQP